MNPLLSAITRFRRRPHFAGGNTRKDNRKARRTRLYLEALEDRLVLSPTVSIANASMNDIGNVSTLVAQGSGGLSGPRDLTLGPDGNMYVVSNGTNSVIRYTPTGQLLGTFVASGSGGLANPYGLAFGPDGNLYVASEGTNAIYEYSGSTGAFLGTFVAAGSGGLNDPKGLAFGPDGNLYVSSHVSGDIMRYEGPAGASPGTPLPAAGQSGAIFVAAGSGGLTGPKDLYFAPDGSLYVASGITYFAVLRFDGTTGNFLNTVVAPGAGGLNNPTGLAIDSDGRLYVADLGSNAIHCFDSQGNYLGDLVSSSASSLRSPIGMILDAQGDLLLSSRDSNAVAEYNSGVLVTMSSASSTPVTVDYATADGTATAGKDYRAQSGTVTFAPGQTAHLVLLATVTDPVIDGNETFNVQLSNPTGGATIANGSAAVTVVDPTWPQLSVSDTSAIEGDTTGHYRGAFTYDAPNIGFTGVAFGPDGNLYTTQLAGGGPTDNTLLRYNGTTGALMGTFVPPGTVNGSHSVVFHNGYMYAASEYTNQVLKYDGTTGAYLGVFVAAGSGDLSGPFGMTFGPDGNLYVTGRNSYNVVEYDGNTGAYIRTFVATGSGGLNLPEGLTFDPSGQYLYVASSGSGQVLKYNGQTGAFVGAVSAAGLSGPVDVKFGPDGLLYVLSQGNSRIMRFNENGNYIDDYAPAGTGGMSSGVYMTFGPNGDLYVAATYNNQILQYGTENEALFTVSLSSAFAMPVTVNYATADGTALAGRDYTATSGTLTFAPGVTSETVRVPLLNDGVAESGLNFTLTLSNPQSATLARSQATGTINDSNAAAKFYVVNDATSSLGGTNSAYKYQASGTPQAPYGLSLNDLDPRGVAANAAGTMQWVVDANKNVYVYNSSGTLLGSWSAGGLPSSANVTGIATNGTDIWLVDSYSDKVYKYTGAASRLSGSQSAASSFSLSGGKNGNPNPQDIVTDGTSLWVVDGSSLKVFKYTLTGKLLGSWSIDPANSHPTGITLNPSNPSDIWIVDSGTDKVYQYVGAASRTSGSQNAAASFALAPGNTNPQGIADPPTAATASTVSSGDSLLAHRDAAFARLAEESQPRMGRQRFLDMVEHLLSESR